MKPGKYVWYVYDLRKEPVRVKIDRVYIDIHGEVRWIWAETGDGRVISDFVNMFSRKMPVTSCGM